MSSFALLDRGPLKSPLVARVPPPQFPRDKRAFLSKNSPMFRLGAILVTLSFVSRLHASNVVEIPNRVIVSVHDQKLMLLQNGARVATYPISTSKFAVGDNRGRMTTPL